MSNLRFNPVTLLLLVATICSTLMSSADVLPEAWLPYIVVIGAVANACASRLIRGADGQGSSYSFNIRPSLALLLLPLLVFASACGPKNVGATARGIAQGAKEVKSEIADMKQDGEIDEAGAKQLTAYFTEIESFADGLDKASANWNALTKAQRRDVLARFIGEIGASAERLDREGYLGIKSVKARKRVDDWKRNIRRGLSVLRVIEASLPVAESAVDESQSRHLTSKR